MLGVMSSAIVDMPLSNKQSKRRRATLTDKAIAITMAVLSAVWFVAIGGGLASAAGYLATGQNWKGALVGAFVGMIGMTSWEFYLHIMHAQNFEGWPPPRNLSFAIWATGVAIVLGSLSAAVAWLLVSAWQN